MNGERIAERKNVHRRLESPISWLNGWLAGTGEDSRVNASRMATTLVSKILSVLRLANCLKAFNSFCTMAGFWFNWSTLKILTDCTILMSTGGRGDALGVTPAGKVLVAEAVGV